MTRRTCQALGGFDPDVHHRTNDAGIGIAVVAHGLAVAMIPDLALPDRHPGVKIRGIAGGPVTRAIFAATRTTDASRPSTQALLAAVREQVPARRSRVAWLPPSRWPPPCRRRESRAARPRRA